MAANQSTRTPTVFPPLWFSFWSGWHHCYLFSSKAVLSLSNQTFATDWILNNSLVLLPTPSRIGLILSGVNILWFLWPWPSDIFQSRQCYFSRSDTVHQPALDATLFREYCEMSRCPTYYRALRHASQRCFLEKKKELLYDVCDAASCVLALVLRQQRKSTAAQNSDASAQHCCQLASFFFCRKCLCFLWVSQKSDHSSPSGSRLIAVVSR